MSPGFFFANRRRKTFDITSHMTRNLPTPAGESVLFILHHGIKFTSSFPTTVEKKSEIILGYTTQKQDRKTFSTRFDSAEDAIEAELFRAEITDFCHLLVVGYCPQAP